MQFIDNWLDNNSSEQSKLSLDEMDMLINSNESIDIELSNLQLEDKENIKLKNQSKEELSSYESLILDELPNFQERIIRPELLNSNDGIIKFYKNLNNIKDDIVKPREYHNHLLKPTVINDNYSYFKNRQVNLLTNFYKYLRINKDSKEIEYLCCLCKGQNWILKSNFKTHLAFSHGILILVKFNKVFKLPIPVRLFIIQNRSFKNYFVKCEKCNIWIALGNNPKKQSLYYNYFLHYIENHKDH